MSAPTPQPIQDSAMATDESMRDDSSARKYNKTSHLQKRSQQEAYAVDPAASASAAQIAASVEAGQPYDPVAEYRRGRALTADNLERIPNADQLAPGIRLPGRVIDPHGADTDMQTSSDADEGAQSLETGHTSVGAFGEGGAPVPGVPPELDPRTPSFRPHSPGEASVFSVAVQPPASPKASILEASEPASPFVESTPSRSATDRYGVPVSSASATAGSSSYSVSARGSSPPLSAGYSASEAFNSAMRLGPGPSMLGRNVASVAPSEAGSVSSTGTGGGPGSAGTADDQEVALRAAYIERQRMRERELMGGEAGVGGTTIPTFALPARGTTPLAFAPGLSARLGGGATGSPAFDNVSRAGSTAATTGTSTPPLSPTGSEIPYAVASPSRRGSVDSTETLGSMRAPPSVQGFELGSGIESRRMSRGGSSAGFADAAYDTGRRGSEGAFISNAMDEDVQESAPAPSLHTEPEAL
ncbi:hypothetical protein PaG_03624 [Moesziomyces aphidis]|uniref:Uncharacterized protein n=1 Tax=Moesziomyces aphidis TaxID=84754 RepID=W3VMP0_MOEAP|nr:hypothetical protein PaG_03624 [Moesziomyces aphidis]